METWAGRWALVTGASSGIGAAFAEELARRGVHCLLVARRSDRLEQTAGRCRSHGTRALTLVADLSLAGAAQQCRAEAVRHGIRISLLVNNAGADPWGRFESQDGQAQERLQMLLIGTPLALCSTFHDDLTGSPGGAVINVSSPAAYQPMPWKVAYAAGKAALQSASLALAEEWAEQGILVQTLVPGPTRSEIETAGNAYDCPLRQGGRQEAAPLVARSLDALGSRKRLVSGQPRLWLQRMFAGLIPYGVLLRSVARLARPPAVGSALAGKGAGVG